MTSMLEAALAYAEKGWPIFPCRANKKPYTDNGVLDATTNVKKIKEWWGKHPMANIGLDVGRMGMMVLDLDPGHDLGELEASIGELPKTKLVQSTPRGGQHLFYALGEGEIVPPSAGKLARNVDVRSFNSYVLLAPSKTADGAYAWEQEGKPTFRTKAMIEKAAEKSRQQREDHDTWIIEPDLEENIDAATAWLKKEADIAIEGVNGDHKAYATACMMKSYGLTPETALELMWEHWNPRCVPPWGAEEIEHFEQKVINGYSYNTSPPGNMTTAYRVAKQAARFKPVLRHTNEAKTASELSGGGFRSVNRSGMEGIKPPSWLITDTIPSGGYGMLVGRPGVFKTFVALDMALSIATGASKYFEDGQWDGMWPSVEKTGPVLFAVGEGRSAMTNRVRAWEKRHLDGDKVENFILIDPVPHPTDEQLDAFIDHALEWHDQYALVVIDTVSRSMQGLNENAQQDAGLFTHMVQGIQAELGSAVLALHHMGHEANRARGSSVFKGDVDFEFTLDREEGSKFVTVANTKQKDAPQWERPRSVQVIEVKVAEGVKSLACVQPSERTLKRQAEDKQTGRKTTQEKSISIDIVRKAAYKVLKSNPAKEFSYTALAQAVAADDAVTIGVQAIRKNYLGNLLTDKAHPIVGCFDASKNCWVYRTPKKA